TRFRNTPAAWPSIKLPEPLDKEFVTAVEVCEALDRNGDKWLLHDKLVPDPKTSDFWPAAKEALAAWRRRSHADAKDFTALVDGFESSEAFKALAGSTRRGYTASGKLVKEAWGFDRPADLTTVDAQQAIDSLGETPATANQFRAYLSRLMAWGIPRGYSTMNPVEHTEKVPGGEPWSPWPEWAFEILIEHAP